MKTIRVGPISSVTETSLTGKRFRKPIRLLVSFPLGWCSAAKPVTCLLYASNISAREINGPLEKCDSNSIKQFACTYLQPPIERRNFDESTFVVDTFSASKTTTLQSGNVCFLARFTVLFERLESRHWRHIYTECRLKLTPSFIIKGQRTRVQATGRLNGIRSFYSAYHYHRELLLRFMATSRSLKRTADHAVAHTYKL